MAVDPKSTGGRLRPGIAGQRKAEETLRRLEATIAPESLSGVALMQKADALRTLRRFEEALTNYDRALQLEFEVGAALRGKADVLRRLERLEEAIACNDRGIELDPHDAPSHFNRAACLQRLRRYGDAAESYERFLALRPKDAIAHNNRGLCLFNVKRYAEAMESYERAVAAKEQFADAYMYKGLLHLLLGEYEQGWALREWTRKTQDYRPWPSEALPFWSGDEPLQGKTIVLVCDFGLGDAIQFCRYVPMVAARGAEIVLGAQRTLHELFATLKAPLRLVPRNTFGHGAQYHAPLSSLPAAFKTRLDTIPDTPYLWAADHKRAAWRARLGPRTKPRIGITWSGNPRHRNDHNRSIPLAGMRPFLKHNFEFHGVQKDIRPEDRAVMNECGVIAHDAELADFSDTAALVAELDLVISVDTAAAHLTGALGQKVWILLPYAPDYRWLAEGERNPWYPTARLFRQPALGDWDSVIARIAGALDGIAAGAAPPQTESNLSER